jgi:hypothetical protein
MPLEEEPKLKRKPLAPEELERVISLHESGQSWLMIQKLTTIPRRTAQREYRRWEASRSIERLETARKDIAAQEFRRHMDAMSEFAMFLTDHLSLPDSPEPIVDAETYLSRLWDRELPALAELYQVARQGPRAQERVRRRNRAILSSLETHTREVINWELLEQWKEAWDKSQALMARVIDSATETLGRAQEVLPDMARGVSPGGAKGSAVEIISGYVVRAVWQVLLSGDRSRTENLFAVSTVDTDRSETPVISTGDRVVLQYHDRVSTARKVRDGAQSAMESVLKQSIVAELGSQIMIMQRLVTELDGFLDPIVLRPVILRTRCVLCPV